MTLFFRQELRRTVFKKFSSNIGWQIKTTMIVRRRNIYIQLLLMAGRYNSFKKPVESFPSDKPNTCACFFVLFWYHSHNYHLYLLYYIIYLTTLVKTCLTFRSSAACFRPYVHVWSVICFVIVKHKYVLFCYLFQGAVLWRFSREKQRWKRRTHYTISKR